MGISAVIITKDEAENIARCIRSILPLTHDIIVVDSGSSDNTMEIATSLGAQVFQYDWQGYGANKNYGASKAKYDWILSIDADEEINPALLASIKSLSPAEDKLYLVNILTSYCGTWIRHCGWHPLWRARLYHRQNHRWNSSILHEELTATSRINKVKLSGIMHHYSYPTKAKYSQKVEYYAKLKAKSWLQQGKKLSWIKRHFGPSFRFFRTFILKLGILDGHAGWEISVMNSYMIKKTILHYDNLSRNPQG